ncbi:MAG: hypothetical protein Unbinned3818contig1000_1 [Prokaryotic dsDNA virus sp.]|nr:hypothetical protein [Phycisphaerae bacterium]QDP45930.1 MAG: hypothetical protein Unbinned3818contig1000_1 [Prokaryotic dsDNA virus sp.]
MKETKVILSGSCELVRTVYGGKFEDDISLDYVERSSDPYYSDNDTSIDISKEAAIDMVKLLTEAFGL